MAGLWYGGGGGGGGGEFFFATCEACPLSQALREALRELRVPRRALRSATGSRPQLGGARAVAQDYESGAECWKGAKQGDDLFYDWRIVEEWKVVWKYSKLY
jgi:hypothetical protein